MKNQVISKVEFPLSNGEVVNIPMLVNTFDGDLAVVHLQTIKKLAALLPSVSFSTIKQNMKYEMDETQNLEEYISLLESEVAFHKSVNLITNYNKD